jgi:phosphatidylglycerophosphate synthase
MPEPKWGTDYYIYKYISKPIAKKSCWLNPNFISTLGLLTTIPIFYNIKNKGSIYDAIILIVINYFFDIFDGSIARKCNKCSKFGEYYDIFSDGIKNIILLISVYLYSKKYKYNNFIILLLVYLILKVIGYIIRLYQININYKKRNFIQNFIHDNLLIFYILETIIIKKICN